MPQSFPQFPGPHSLPDGRSLSAEFGSFDPRNDDAYYFVRVSQHDGGQSEFFVRLDVLGGVPDRDSLLQGLLKHAAAGGNTSYQGSVMWQMRRAKAERG